MIFSNSQRTVSIQSSSEKLLAAADGNRFRDPVPDIILSESLNGMHPSNIPSHSSGISVEIVVVVRGDGRHQ